MLAIDSGRPKTLISRSHRLLHRAPPRGHPPPHPLRVAQGRGARRDCSKPTSRPATSTTSSASSATPNRDEARASCSPTSSPGHRGTLGILIRSEAASSRRPLRLHRAPGGRHPRTPPLSAHRLEIGQGQGRIRRTPRASRTCSTSSPARIACRPSSRTSSGAKAKHATPRLTEIVPTKARSPSRTSSPTRRDHHPHPQRPDQTHQRQPNTAPAPRRQGRHRHGHPRGRQGRGPPISSSTSSPPAPTTT
jgi:hypothetical protein